MARITVWDYPVRVFHWVLALCFFSALGLAQFAPEHSRLFDLHMLIGLILAPMVFLRIVWGFIGTKYARFSSFIFGPKEVFEYLASIITLNGRHYVGHNPAASYAAFAMLVLVLCIVATGLLMQSGEFFEEVHGILAYVMFAVVVTHVCGVALHVFRCKENIILSMLSGCKDGKEEDAIASPKPVISLVFLLLVGTWTTMLVRGYDRQTQRVGLPFIGKVIQLGEGEKHDGNHRDHDED
jgi:cytochrome b